MAQPRVTVLDYGIGNVYSVCRAVERCGGIAELVDRCPKPADVERLVVPGVGAFADCLAAMRRYGADDLIRRFHETGRPLLGICVGMQALFDVGEEFGAHPGLGIIPGRVVRLDPRGEGGRPLKLPHIGWAPLHMAGRNSWDGTPLAPVADGESTYFVHSFHGQPDDPAHLLAVTHYGSSTVTAAVNRDNATGVQFHPERSGPVGLRIVSSFLST